MTRRISRLADALAARRAAEQEITETLRIEWPIGSAITWERADRRYQGVVVMHSYDDRIKVKNNASAAMLWIGAGGIVA